MRLGACFCRREEVRRKDSPRKDLGPETKADSVAEEPVWWGKGAYYCSYFWGILHPTKTGVRKLNFFRFENEWCMFLFSSAKILKLLVYSLTIYTLNSFLCDHTISPDLPASRLNIVRHFSTVSVYVSFTLSISLRSTSTPNRARYWHTTHTLLRTKEGSEDEARPKKELSQEVVGRRCWSYW